MATLRLELIPLCATKHLSRIECDINDTRTQSLVGQKQYQTQVARKDAEKSM